MFIHLYYGLRFKHYFETAIYTDYLRKVCLHGQKVTWKLQCRCIYRHLFTGILSGPKKSILKWVSIVMGHIVITGIIVKIFQCIFVFEKPVKENRFLFNTDNFTFSHILKWKKFLQTFQHNMKNNTLLLQFFTLLVCHPVKKKTTTWILNIAAWIFFMCWNPQRCEKINLWIAK